MDKTRGRKHVLHCNVYRCLQNVKIRNIMEGFQFVAYLKLKYDSLCVSAFSIQLNIL